MRLDNEREPVQLTCELGMPVTEEQGPSIRMRSLIEPLVPRILRQLGTRDLVTLAVIGSAARGEETWNMGQLVSDVDLAAIVSWPLPLSAGRSKCATRGIARNVELGILPIYSLGRYRSLEFFQARCSAWILWGKRDVFQQVRIETAEHIPSWEGLRLLLNRALDCVAARAKILPYWYAATKTYLALGEADLVFSKEYTPSYRSRWELHKAKGTVLCSNRLFEWVDWATRVKLGLVSAPDVFDPREHEQWLLYGLRALLSQYLGESLSLQESIGRLRARSFHPAHRCLYLLRHWRSANRVRQALVADPVYGIWEQAIAILESRSDASEFMMRELIIDFQQTMQPLLQ